MQWWFFPVLARSGDVSGSDERICFSSSVSADLESSRKAEAGWSRRQSESTGHSRARGVGSLEKGCTDRL
ncbi:unnamed protein product [Toxocara canis]|uniref:Secreted protein n=1 Tax=Toxocara canis TaxID=6265 RepID=A0A183U5Q0_TOXCA|nr:unnamed protein product [Toxocara canis]